MIPVPQESVYLLDMKSKSYGYKRLLSEQYSYINKPDAHLEMVGTIVHQLTDGCSAYVLQLYYNYFTSVTKIEKLINL